MKKLISFNLVEIKIDPLKRENIKSVECLNYVTLKHSPLTVNGRNYPNCINVTTEKGKVIGCVPEPRSEIDETQDIILNLLKNNHIYVAVISEMLSHQKAVGGSMIEIEVKSCTITVFS